MQPHYFMQIEGEKVEVMTDFLFLDSKITANGDCSHEIRRCLLLGRKSITGSTVSPSICHAVMRTDAMILVF